MKNFLLAVSFLQILMKSAFGNNVALMFGWSHFECDGVGPSTWASRYNGCNATLNPFQSPIDLKDAFTTYSKQPTPISFSANFEQPVQFEYVSDLNFFRLNPRAQMTFSTFLGSNNSLTTGYFYWGTNANDGTEHAINGEKYAAEMHFFSTGNNGMAVTLVSLFEESAQDNTEIQGFIDTLDIVLRIPANGFETKASVTIPSLRKLLPADLSDYYHYNGTFSWPFCNQLKYIVFNNKIPVSATQLEKLRALYYETTSGSKVNQAGRLRPIQELNDRKIFKSIPFFPNITTFWDHIETKPYKDGIVGFLS